MKQKAIDGASQMLERAKQAAHQLEYSTTTAEARAAWRDFLMAAGSAFSKLQTGAMGDGKSRAWMGRKHKERKDDPVLSYAHQARNVADHGIEEVADPGPGHVLIGAPEGTLCGNFAIGVDGRITIEGVEGYPLHIHIATSHIRLVAVRDERFGTTFSPPMKGIHRLTPYSAGDVATVVLRATETMIEEAKGFVH